MDHTLHPRPMKCTLTGSTGYLGSALIQTLLRQGHEVVAITRSSNQLFAGKQGYGELFLSESEESVAQRVLHFRPDVIIHTAALTSAQQCEKEPDQARRSNIEFTQRIARLAQSCGAHLIVVSTDLVFDGREGVFAEGLDEEQLPSPRSIYSQTKLAAENEARQICQRTTVVRVSLLYGPAIGLRRGGLAWMIDAAKAGNTVDLFTDEWRTPIYVYDAARALLALAARGESGLFHCGGPERINRVGLGTLLSKLLNPKLKIHPCTRAERDLVPPRPEDVSLNSAKLLSCCSRFLDDTPFCTVSEGLRRALQPHGE